MVFLSDAAINLNIFELESSAYKTWRGKYNVIVVMKKNKWWQPLQFYN